MRLYYNGEPIDSSLPIVPIRSSEYDALTDDERNAEVLYLVDDPSASSSSSSGSCLNKYSTEETVIGTWIDGKPIYRKVLEANISITSGYKTIGYLENLGHLVNIYGYGDSSDGWMMSCNSNNVGVYVNKISGEIRMYSNGDPIARFVTNSFITIEYTKTTD